MRKSLALILALLASPAMAQTAHTFTLTAQQEAALSWVVSTANAAMPAGSTPYASNDAYIQTMMPNVANSYILQEQQALQAWLFAYCQGNVTPAQCASEVQTTMTAAGFGAQ